MLRITMSKSAAGAKKYYCESYYKEGRSEHLDYYSEGREAIGRWSGKAVAQLGLSGDIAKADFAALCDNINPASGKTLTGRQDSDRTVGYDFTFNASKSVSLAYTFGSEAEKKEILDAFQQSVRETMSEIEGGMQTRVRAKGKNENRLTGNLAYGEFTHFTTRPIEGLPDPHLHSHCFVFNATWDAEEDKWKAGQFMPLKQDAPYYEAIFHSRLATKLQSLGYRVQRTKNGFELAGIEKSTLDKFSRRTKEIEAYAEAHNIIDEGLKSQVGAKTREAKRAGMTASQQQTAWQSRLTAEEAAKLRSLKGTSAASEKQTGAAKAALQFSLAHHLERKSVASDKEILATAIKASIGESSPEAVKRAFNENDEILRAEENLRRFVTTRDALREEKQLITAANRSKNKFRPIHKDYQVQNSLLGEQQQRAVRHALSSTDGVIIIKGKAGTGKTTLMTEVKLGIEASGKRIYAFAPSSEASRGVQRSEGFEDAETVAMLTLDKTRHAQFKNQVIWVDEAGMLSNSDANRILSIAEAQSARVIFSGDDKQHSSIERGDALRILQKEAGIKPVTVDKIQRQRQTLYREAVELLSSRKREKAFKKLDDMGAIHEIANSSERIEAIAEDYHRSTYAHSAKAPVRNVLVIAPTHAEGDAVSERIRSRLKEAALIGSSEYSFTALKNLQLSKAEKQNPESYQAGQILGFHQNMKGVKAGTRLDVSKADTDSIHAIDGAGNSHLIPYSAFCRFSVFEPKQVGMAEGDKLRITANGRSMEGTHLFNGGSYYVRGFDNEGNIRLSNGATLSRDYGHFQHGYVGTSHASQGKTADKVIISQSSATFRASSEEQFYVSVSRGRQAVSIYTDDKEHLQQAVARSAQRTSATELMEMKQRQQQEMQRSIAQQKSQEISQQLIAKAHHERVSPAAQREQRDGR
jgi:conjugative relaxase-like TrwC/TraI family protein